MIHQRLCDPSSNKIPDKIFRYKLVAEVAGKVPDIVYIDNI
jgi:hypothetical protein